MIEDAIIHVGGKPYLTRLHEHGRQPTCKEDQYSRSKWLFSGYMEGKETTLTALKNSGVSILEFHCKNELIVLTGIIWDGLQAMTGDHFILHLHWEKKASNNPKSLRGVIDVIQVLLFIDFRRF